MTLGVPEIETELTGKHDDSCRLADLASGITLGAHVLDGAVLKPRRAPRCDDLLIASETHHG